MHNKHTSTVLTTRVDEANHNNTHLKIFNIKLDLTIITINVRKYFNKYINTPLLSSI